MLPQRDRAKLVNLMYNWGINDAEKVIKLLKTKRDLHGCATALLAAQHVFGVKSRIAKESEDEIVIQATKCLWKEKEGWTPEICAAIEAYEIGLVKGINKNVQHICTKRRSKGDKVCELLLKMKNSLLYISLDLHLTITSIL